MSEVADVRWQKGGEARFTAATDDKVSLLSTLSSAPGSRLDGLLPSGSAVRVKVHRCVRTDDGFAIDGRLLDARREVRDEVAALSARGPAG